jgi:hypothetical protein
MHSPRTCSSKHPIPLSGLLYFFISPNPFQNSVFYGWRWPLSQLFQGSCWQGDKILLCSRCLRVSAFCWSARQPTSHCQKFGAQGVIQVRTQQGVAEKYTRSTIKLSVHNKIVGALNQIRLFKASVMKKPNFLSSAQQQ